MNQLTNSPKVNTAMAKKIIALHSQGYDFDFLATTDNEVLCIQDNQLLTDSQVLIKVVDLCFDNITRRYKYIHTVETCSGDKGLLIDSCICINSILAARIRCASTLPKTTGAVQLHVWQQVSMNIY